MRRQIRVWGLTPSMDFGDRHYFWAQEPFRVRASPPKVSIGESGKGKGVGGQGRVVERAQVAAGATASGCGQGSGSPIGPTPPPTEGASAAAPSDDEPFFQGLSQVPKWEAKGLAPTKPYQSLEESKPASNNNINVDTAPSFVSQRFSSASSSAAPSPHSPSRPQDSASAPRGTPQRAPHPTPQTSSPAPSSHGRGEGRGGAVVGASVVSGLSASDEVHFREGIRYPKPDVYTYACDRGLTNLQQAFDEYIESCKLQILRGSLERERQEAARLAERAEEERQRVEEERRRAASEEGRRVASIPYPSPQAPPSSPHFFHVSTCDDAPPNWTGYKGKERGSKGEEIVGYSCPTCNHSIHTCRGCRDVGGLLAL